MERSPNFLQWEQRPSGQYPQPWGAWLYTVSAWLQWVFLWGSVWYKWRIILLEILQNFKKKLYLFDMNIYREAHRYIGQKNQTPKAHKRNQCSLNFLFHGFHSDFHLFFTAWNHLKEITVLVNAVFGLIICLRHLVAVDTVMEFTDKAEELHFLLVSHFLTSWKKNVN